MKKKVTIHTNIVPMPQTHPDLKDRYMVQIQYVQGGMIFTNTNHGKGLELRAAQDLAYTMRDHIKSED